MPPAVGPASMILQPPIWAYCVAVWVTLFPGPTKSPLVQRQPAAAAGPVQAALRRELGRWASHAQADVENMSRGVVVWQKEVSRVSGGHRIHGRAGNVHEQPQDSLPPPRCACPIALRKLTHESSIKFAPAESRAGSNIPAYRDGFEAHGVGIGTAGDAALEEISRVHRLVSRRSWKGSSLSDACPVHSVAPEPSALLREHFELPLLCTPTGSSHTHSGRAPDARGVLRTLASREAEVMVEVGGSAERLSSSSS
ncbi:hypothetical protein K438DRAFT_1787390 [Mycena galopus ATCC 62051]|nr:hypothetical protein K438DRAFT_1787390 [Mycena galopus ATCC 62051]